MENMEKNLKSEATCSVDYETECKALADMNTRLKYENYNLKMAVKHLTEVIANGYKQSF